MKIALASASLEQLQAVATEKGLTFAPNIGVEKLLAKIKAVHEGDEIEVPDAPVATAAPAKGGNPQGDTYAWVRVSTVPGEQGDQPVWCACNGKGTWVPRGKWCHIRSGYLESLRNAVEAKYDVIKDEEGFDKISPEPKWVQRHPLEVWSGGGEPPKSEQYVPPETTGADRPKAA